MTQTHAQLQQLVLEHLALTDMSDEEKAQIAQQALDVLSKRVFVDLVPALSEEDRFVLRDMLSDGELSDEEMEAFLRDILPRYADVVRASVEAFFAEMRSALAQTSDADSEPTA